MQSLNLPPYSFRIKKENGNTFIFDSIRNKFIALTQEEWVRQHMLRYLLEDLAYPKGLIKVETGVAYNSRMKRSDIVAYNTLGKPELLIECKSPGTKISQSTMEQAAMYNRTLQASVIVLTNGITHYTFSLSSNGKIINHTEIPKYSPRS